MPTMPPFVHMKSFGASMIAAASSAVVENADGARRRVLKNCNTHHCHDQGWVDWPGEMPEEGEDGLLPWHVEPSKHWSPIFGVATLMALVALLCWAVFRVCVSAERSKSLAGLGMHEAERGGSSYTEYRQY